MRSARLLVVLCALFLVVLPALSYADTSFSQFLSQLEQEYNLPSGILGKVAQIESGGNATICASTSSACGLYQWTTNSWLAATKALYGQPLSLSERNSPTESAKVTAFELAEIKTQIGSLITQANVNMSVGLYLGHFLGSGGAKVLLTAYIQNPGQSACSLLPKACAANRSVLSQSVSGVINFFAQKMQVAGVPNVTGDFAGSNGISYAYSSADLVPGDFLPANTTIGVDPQYDYAPVFTSVASPQQLLPTTPSLPYAPQTTPPASYTTPLQASQALSSSSGTQSPICTPQYSCTNNAEYYESATCSMSQVQSCQYGCSGTTCAASPSASNTTTISSSTSITNISPLTGSSVTSSSPVTVSSASSLSTEGTAAGSSSSSALVSLLSTATTIGTSTPTSLGQTISDVVNGLTTASGLATTSLSIFGTSVSVPIVTSNNSATSAPTSLAGSIYTILEGGTLTESSATGTVLAGSSSASTSENSFTPEGELSPDQAASQLSSPFLQVLGELKTVLGGLLNYLSSL